MLHKCANPDCKNPFLKLSEGKLFLVESGGSRDADRAPSEWERRNVRRVEYFWLCNQCSLLVTLAFEKERGMVTVPLPEEMRRRPAPVSQGEKDPDTARPLLYKRA